MKLSRTLMTSAIALAAATPAFADLTAEQVLADQLAQMKFYGLDVEVAGQSRDGDALVVEGLTATANVPDGAFDMTIGGATFTEQSDGTVVITYPDTIPVTISGTADEGEDFEMIMNMVQVGTRTVVSGTPEEVRYDFTADSFAIEEITFTAPEEAAELDMDVSITMTGMSGMMELAGTTVRDYTAEFAFDAFSALISGAPEGDGTFDLTMNGENLTAKYDGRLAPQELMGSFAQAITAGNRTEGSASHGPLTYNIKADGPDGSFEGAFAVGSGTFDFTMNENGLDYGGVSKDMTASVGGSAIPLPPMTFKMAETGGRFAMPVVPSEDEQGFALRMSMVGLELDPMLWGMFDPTGQLTRDPATIVIDVDGDVVLTEDIFDPAVAEEMMGPPGQINAVNINEILLTLAGAELTGDGAFTFNNDSVMPVPSGVVNMMLKGGNGLLDKLVGMGLIPEEQAMGARMMMGLFARPGDGDDTLVSTIEVKEDGSVLANGQRIR